MKKLSALLAGIIVLSAMSPLNASAGEITGYTATESNGGGGNDWTYYYYYDLAGTYNEGEEGKQKKGYYLNQNVLLNNKIICKGKDTVGYKNACKLETDRVKKYVPDTFNNEQFLPIDADSFDYIEKNIDNMFKDELLAFLGNKNICDWHRPGYKNNLRMLKNPSNGETYYYLLSSMVKNPDDPPISTSDMDIINDDEGYKMTVEFDAEDFYEYYWKLMKYDLNGNSTNYVSKYGSEASNVRFDKPIECNFEKKNIDSNINLYSETSETARNNFEFYPFANYRVGTYNFFNFENAAKQIEYGSSFEYHLYEYYYLMKNVTVRIYHIQNNKTEKVKEEKFTAQQLNEASQFIANNLEICGGKVLDELDNNNIIFSFVDYKESKAEYDKNHPGTSITMEDYLKKVAFSYIYTELSNSQLQSKKDVCSFTVDLNNSSNYSVTLPDIKLDNWVDLKSETFINQNTPVLGENFEPKFSTTNIADQVNNRIINGNRITASDIDTSKILTQDLSGDNLNIKLDSSKRPSYDFTTLSDNNAKHIKLGFNGSNFGVDNSPVEVNSIDINGAAVGTQFDLVSAESQPKLYVGYQQTKDPETMTIKTDSSEDTDGAYVYNPTDSVDIGVKSMKYDDVGRPLGFSTCETNFWFTIPRVGTINELGFFYNPSVPGFLDASNITHDMVVNNNIPTDVAEQYFNDHVKNDEVKKLSKKYLLTESYIQPVLSGDIYTKDAAGNN